MRSVFPRYSVIDQAIQTNFLTFQVQTEEWKGHRVSRILRTMTLLGRSPFLSPSFSFNIFGPRSSAKSRDEKSRRINQEREHVTLFISRPLFTLENRFALLPFSLNWTSSSIAEQHSHMCDSRSNERYAHVQFRNFDLFPFRILLCGLFPFMRSQYAAFPFLSETKA